MICSTSIIVKASFTFVLFLMIHNAFGDINVGDMCLHDQVTSCSFQIPSDDPNVCQIYNTAACKTFNFSTWMFEEPIYPSRESQASFKVLAEAFSKSFGMYSYPFVNISFESGNTEINGFVLHLLEQPSGRNICRIFDLRKAGTKVVSLYYDCLMLQLAKGGQQYQLVVRALPANEVQAYSIFVPDSKEINTDVLCQWKPLVMVYEYSLGENVVEVRFTKAPDKFDVSSYAVVLYETKSEGERLIVSSKSVEETADEKMLRGTFSDVDMGSYAIDIQAMKKSAACLSTSTVEFHILAKMKDKRLVVYISMLVVIVLLLTVVIFQTVRWGIRLGYFGSSKKIFVVHSLDHEESNSVVYAFLSVIKSIWCEVDSNYGPKYLDPTIWLQKCYQKADIVVIVITHSVYHKITRSNNNCIKHFEPGGWDDRFTPAYIFLREEMLHNRHFLRNKKVCKVYFSYSGVKDIPKELQFGLWGETFALPEKMHEFVHHVDHTTSSGFCGSKCVEVRRPDCSTIPGMKQLHQCIDAAKLVDVESLVAQSHSCNISTEEPMECVNINHTSSLPDIGIKSRESSEWDLEDDSESTVPETQGDLKAILFDSLPHSEDEISLEEAVFNPRSAYIELGEEILPERNFWKHHFESKMN